jgi:drug/metabolite transporter (DMT)-like permease
MPRVSDVSAPTASAVARPSGRDLGLIGIAVLAISTSGPLIVATAAPALAIAFWRNAFGALAIAPWALTRHRQELRGLTRRQWWLGVLGGGWLAAHFATWVPSLDYTSVASSTALVATQPAWAALIARARGHDVPGRAWAGMAVAFVGVLLITGIDFAVSPEALFGDLLALVGAVFAAAYVTTGASARRTTSTTVYTLIAYATTAALLGLGALAVGDALTGFDAETWAKLLALTAGAQLLGHSLFAVVLKTTKPTVLSLAILFEMPGAAIIAALWLGQLPPPAVYPAMALLLVGMAIVVRAEPQLDQPQIP